MSTRVRCSLNYGGSRYATTKQAVAMAAAFYRQNTGRYYLVKKGTTPLWKYLVEMVEKTPDWPEGAKLKVWREKRGRGRAQVTVTPQRAARAVTGTTTVLPMQAGDQIHFTRPTRRTFQPGAGDVPLTWRAEVPRAER